MFALNFLPLLIIIPLIVIAVITLLIYTVVCNRRIKKQLGGEKIYKHQYIAPKNIIIIILSVMLVIMIIALTAVCIYKKPNTNSDNYQSVFYTPEELEASTLSVYKDAYTQESLEGYAREEHTEDNFRYILYKSKDHSNTLLYPSFIMFVEYTGTKNYQGCIAMDSIQFSDGDQKTVTHLDEIPEYYFVCGNTDANADYTFTFGLYSDNTIQQDDFSNQNCIDADETFEICIK